MKKLLPAFVLLLTLSLQSVALADVAPEPDAFTDVQWGDDYYWEVLWLKDEGIVSGYEDGTYHPEATINRAEFSKIVAIAAWNFDAESAAFDGGALTFTDISDSDWFEPYVHKLYEQNVVSGYSDNTFRPGNDVNFAEAAKMIMIAYGSGELESTGEWYEPYVEMLEGLGAVPESILDNGQYITRGEMAEIIYNAAQNK